MTEERRTFSSLQRTTRSRAVQTVLQELETSYGGRSEMAADLAHLESEEAQTLLRLMADPKRQSDSLLTLCADANIAPITLLTLLKDASFNRAMIDSRLKIAARLPTVIDKVADAAEGGLEACPCTIGGTVDALETCPKCRGNGRIFSKASLPHQRMMLEVAQLVQAPGATNVQVQTGVNVSVGGGKGNFFDQMVKGFGQSLQVLDQKRPEERRETPSVPEVVDAEEVRLSAGPSSVEDLT